MRKTPLALAGLFLATGAPSLAQPVPGQPTPMERVVGQMRPGLRAILQKQALPAGSAAKPTQDERLMTMAYRYGTGSTASYDSINYTYSGGRGCDFSGGIWSYFEDYSPIYPIRIDPAMQHIQRFRYDLQSHYIKRNTGPLYLFSNRTIAYDAANNVTGTTEKTYSPAGLLTSQRSDTFDYNGGDELTSALGYSDTSDDMSGLYQADFWWSATYAGGRRATDTIVYLLWPSPDTGRSANAYFYNAAGLLTTSFEPRYDQPTNTWLTDVRTTYTYDAAGRVKTAHTDRWNASTSTWQPETRDSFGYTGAVSLVTFRESEYYGVASVTLQRYIMTLNSADGYDSMKIFDNAASGGALLGQYARYGFQYNASNHITHMTGTYKHYLTGDPVPLARRFYYAPATGVAPVKTISAATFASLHPNPAGSHTTVSLANPKGTARFVITNMAGQPVYEYACPAQADIRLNIAALPAGTYSIAVSMGNEVQVLRLAKE